MTRPQNSNAALLDSMSRHREPDRRGECCRRQRTCAARVDPRGGFSLMEMLIVVAIVGILATLALPSFQSSVVRDQIVAAAPLIDAAKKPVVAAWAATQILPVDNAGAGLPAPAKMVGNHVRSVAIENGVVQVTFGNQANSAIAGKTLSFRPAVVDDAPVVPVAWACGYAAVPVSMSVKGENRTNIPVGLLPYNCHGPAQ